jgi:Fe-S-cluster containining protein
MPDENNGKTYSFDVCSQCKVICCKDANPPLTLKRQKIISDYLQEQKTPVKDFVREDYCHPAANPKGYCVLYKKETGKCRVHHVKPETCRAGPVTFDINLRTRKIEWFLKKGEICALAQKLYDNGNQLKEHLDVAKAEILRLVCELDSDALKAILKIEEPQTFKIGEDDLPKEALEKLGIS